MILLIDANNLAFRADQTSKLSLKSGKHVGAIYGTLRMIQSYLTEDETLKHRSILSAVWEQQFVHADDPYFRKVICAWDGGKSAFRKALYPEYKQQREKKRLLESEEDKENYKQFINQMKEIDEMLPSFGVHSVKVPHYEADDIIYYLSRKISEPIVIVSTDKDMLQLVCHHVAVWSPYRQILYTKDNFKDAVGLKKTSFIDYRVLVGDPSDNIKGIRGIGDKTAKQLVGQYGSIENMFKDRKHLIRKVRTAHLFEQENQIDLNRKLMDMRNIPLDETVKKQIDEKIMNTIHFNDEEVKKILMKYHFTSILSQLLEWSVPFRGLEE